MKKIYKIIIVLLIVIVAVTVFWQSNNNHKKQVNNPIKIGAILSLTGVAADFGDMSQKAIKLAVEEINQNGGIDGRLVELYIEDDQTTPQTAISAYQKLNSINHADAIVGGLFDFTAQPLFPIAEQNKKVFISPVNFQIDNSFEMNKYSFVMYPKFSKVISELDSVIKDKNVKHLGMIRYKSSFGESIQSTLSQIMQNKGELTVETYSTIGSSDFRTNILKLKDKNLDSVFLDMLDFDIVKYISIAESLQFKPQVIAYTTLRDVFNNPKVDKSKLEGAIMIDWEVPSDEFIKRFESKYGEKPRRGANKSYDAVYVLAEAIAKANTEDGVATYLEKNSFTTVNGKTAFDESHAVENTPINIYQIVNGEMEVVKSVR